MEAIRIRKIGYGYRISFQDFGEQFWPIVGDRLYEAIDGTIVAHIFNKAAELNNNDP